MGSMLTVGDNEKGPLQFSMGTVRVNPAEFASKLEVDLGDPEANDWVKRFLTFHVKRASEGKKEGHKGRATNMRGEDLHQLYKKHIGQDPEQVPFPEEWVKKAPLKKDISSQQPIDIRNATIQFSVQGKKKFEFVLAYVKAHEAQFRDSQYGFKLNGLAKLFKQANEEAKDIQEDAEDANQIYTAAITIQKPKKMLTFSPTQGEPIDLNLDDFDEFKNAFCTYIKDEGLLRFIFDTINQRMAQSGHEKESLDIQERIQLYEKQQLDDQ